MGRANPSDIDLSRAIAEYIGSARGVFCSPDQVLITTGAQQGLDLMSRLLLDPGDFVWVEDPGYHLAKHAFQAVGAKIVPVRVDRQGIDVSASINTEESMKSPSEEERTSALVPK